MPCHLYPVWNKSAARCYQGAAIGSTPSQMGLPPKSLSYLSWFQDIPSSGVAGSVETDFRESACSDRLQSNERQSGQAAEHGEWILPNSRVAGT